MDVMTKNKTVPKLRFKKFDNSTDINSYTRYSFTDVFHFSSGKNIKQNEASPEFKIPCVRYGELYHMYGEVIYNIINKTNLPESELLFSKGDEILLPSAGEEPIGIGAASALPFENIAIGRTINILRPKDKEIYSQFYASYYINEKLKKEIARLAKGVSISNVYNSDLKKLKIILPNLEEQKKVASFISAVDEKIQQLAKKKELLEEYKKGVMQKIFSQELRFKDSNGNNYPDWEEIKLGEVLDYEQPGKYIVKSTKYDNSYKTPVLTAGKTFLLGYTDEIENIFLKTPVIIFDDFTMANKFVDFPFKVKSSAMKILKPSDENVNMVFIYKIMQMIIYPKGDEHKRFWISEYSKIKISYPSNKEQKKIANFLSSLDSKIDLVSTQIENTKAFKKGLLQQMFV